MILLSALKGCLHRRLPALGKLGAEILFSLRCNGGLIDFPLFESGWWLSPLITTRILCPVSGSWRGLCC